MCNTCVYIYTYNMCIYNICIYYMLSIINGIQSSGETHLLTAV